MNDRVSATLKRVFLDRVPMLVAALDTARRGLSSGDPEAVLSIRRIAHTLKGSSAMVGFPEIGEYAKEIAAESAISLENRVDGLIALLKGVLVTELGEIRTFLVVEDDPVMAALFVEILAGPDRKILSAANGAEAEVYLRDHGIALVVLDLHLPDSDGRTILMNLRNDPRTASIPAIVVSARMGPQQSIECMALGASDYFEKPFDPNVFSAAVADALALASARTDLTRDRLTGLGNRVRLAEAWKAASAQARRSHQPISVAILDLDRFKGINDTHGHPVGDQVLRRFGALIADRLRETDVAGRWGGEEFVVLLPMTDATGGVKVLETLLVQFRSECFTGFEGATFNVTFSAGLIEADPDLSLDEAVAEADKFLYHAKRAGRARVISAAGHDTFVTRGRIFVAEDDEVVVRLLVERLEREGFEVVVAGNGAEAQRLLEHEPFELAILDIQMPEANGLEILRRIRARPLTASMPVIILSVLGSETDIVRGFECGADDYVVKPFSPLELVVRVRNLIRS